MLRLRSIRSGRLKLTLSHQNPIGHPDIHVEGNMLTVKGEWKTEGKGPEYRETFYGKFERAVTLSHGVKPEKIAARYENGVLEILVPLPAELAGRKIPIEIEGGKKRIESKAA